VAYVWPGTRYPGDFFAQDDMTALYLQVLGIGLVWTTFHCVGMCGPIIAGVTTAPGDRSLPRGTLMMRRFRRVLAYQGGRAVTYAILGATAGLVGATAEASLGSVTRAVSLLMALVVITAGVMKLPPVAARLSARFTGSGEWVGNLIRATSRLGKAGSARRMVLTGAAMGLLPCMLMFWVLAYSASSASVIHGAALMVVLVVLTTPALVSASCASALSVRGRGGPWVVPAMMLLSGVWLGLEAAAANDWIPHVHLPFRLFGDVYTLMLF
jgi:sulfite exporter TauE/SafE